jgi:hypothetical protein
VWLLLLHDAPVEAASEGPPWWFLVAIVAAILAAALFTMRLALSSGRRRRGGVRCPACGSSIKPAWVRCPSCGAETRRDGARSNGASAPAAAPRMGPAVLEFVKGPLTGRSFPLDRDVTTVGSVDGNSVVLQDTGVSRKHVGIRKIDGGFELADLGSTNGVFVNGEKSARRRLVAGDVIRIGTSEAVFRG